MSTTIYRNTYNTDFSSLLNVMSTENIRKTDWFSKLLSSEKLLILQAYRYENAQSSRSNNQEVDSISDDNKITKLIKNGFIRQSVFRENIIDTTIHDNGTRSCNTILGLGEIKNNILPLARLNSNIYLGAFIDGKTIVTEGFGEYTLPNHMERKPMNISLNLHQAESSTEASVPIVRQGTVNDTINDVLNSNITHLNSVNSAISFNTIKSKVGASVSLNSALSIGIPEELMALIEIPAEVSSQADINVSSILSSSSTYFLGEVYTVGYTAMVSRSSVSDLYTGNQSEISENALYVSSIGYGRKIYMLLRGENLEAELKSSFKQVMKIKIEDIGASASGEAKLKSYFRNNQITLNIVTIGTNPIDIGNISTYDQFIETLQIINSSPTETYRPINYTLDFLDGSGTALVESKDKSYYRECRKIATRYRVTLKSISAPHVIDLNGDEEIYGDIKLEIYNYDTGSNITVLDNKSKYLFNQSASNYKRITTSESFIEEEREFLLPTNSNGRVTDNIEIKISFNLKDKVDFWEGHVNNEYVQYDNTYSRHRIDSIGNGITNHKILNEEHADATLKITYSIGPVN